MKKKTALLLMLVMLCLFLSACAGKMTTIRPTLISRIVVRDCATEETAEHLRGEQQELDWLMDDLVFQMEQLYLKDGKCADTDGHVYQVSFYMDDRLELTAFVNGDGSVCKKGSRYVQLERDDNDHPVDLARWDDFFGFSGQAD